VWSVGPIADRLR